MKAYTDLEQSKRLAEILPPESADFHFSTHLPEVYLEKPIWGNPEYADYNELPCLPCWSLAALLNALPMSLDNWGCLALINTSPDGDSEWLCCYEDDNGNILKECYADNQVDACVEMILKLHKEKPL